MSNRPQGTTVSPFARHWIPFVAGVLDVPSTRRRALDLAMGEGRHVLLLAEAGFVTFGVDRSLERLQAASARVRQRALTVSQWAADLDTYPLPRERFDLLFCTRFLLRARWEELRDLVTPGGFVIYETFTAAQIKRGFGPSSPDHLLQPGELRGAFGDWQVAFCEETEEPAAMARLVARKPAA